jgi:hypothetical protein
VVWEASHFSPYCRNVIRPAVGSMYCPRDMSASVVEGHFSASRFFLAGKLLDFSVPSGPM